MKLYIDTSNSEKLAVGLDGDIVEDASTDQRSEKLLAVIDQMLKKHNKKIEDISEIEINLGPGSFTGLRVGVAIANTLGWLLDIPINGKKGLVEPIYT
ncbi:MAG: tRNA (adenosine(37)-N6)-threonylcarbamoyltransferase complex dimerization subunit type 1 TsaB [Candidatus Blackburnbacteria bacterium RIFCSPHIGHO2_02_FULL_39_13]|uniref:tRNA (Adenosine(37)-N6)-threonylcarbamoyltransferase complex dimerization subunit type 1 TsaB n=1 Tax=Candidatus Blackburnbacteria bacterium RIFCSPLOWO2_01_FULL_40_20 TaxID=1797519 RepID=A0A1G1VE41_9BACT|nr:MAG: Peptidase M22 family protein [Microgenomates group bacterium GW2011_GWA2_39_19]OGY06801.1 MAG: tRNA (adenosine(37)-N6)-threonylcarbamoyltransferase complex dimerization subunit type 1 TsaB [Candidatus Blackburnbacteria bacterium RIFCSPHIGHO2_01_FULL_40_17]OGY09017.1 MAG: tRNA (adenosine(37)-N6)-threonylcarbamoyltransferase complex dimerization subunit type 1 TsaB [Candidatus Blackburnbacteria bacterium RIFCSPHIGHO2_02_FULL_39_13]OGY13685.1 MAG: tRNA (adenosine(37)-N6)-threonylcarbamoyltr